MRSRYSAFVLRDEAHLLRTWHVTTRPASVDVEGLTWTGLEVLRTERGGEGDTLGVVEFRAGFEQGGEEGALHEVSRFARDPATGWTYVRGRHPD